VFYAWRSSCERLTADVEQFYAGATSASGNAGRAAGRGCERGRRLTRYVCDAPLNPNTAGLRKTRVIAGA
jgi:hypothetical protein